MSHDKRVIDTNEIQNAMLNPELITHLHGFKIANQWGEVDGRQLLIDVYSLCEQHENLKRELAAYKK